jgi:branched-chain amino acid transport system permease protein
MLLLQTLLNGTVLGAGYAVIAVGLSLVFGILGIANFAHGAFFALGGYAVYLLGGAGLPYLVALPLAVLGVAVVGLATEILVVRRTLYGEGQHGAVIVTFALGQAITAASILLLGPDPHPVSSPFNGSAIHFGGLVVTGQRGVIFASALAVLAGFGLWLGRSTRGQQIVAVAQNARGALYAGINVPRIRTISFVLGVAGAGLAGGLLAPIVTAYPTMGHSALVTGFMVGVLGGMGSISGPLIAAFLLGWANALFETYVSVSWTPALGWGLVILVLLLRPQGLRGRAIIHRS